ncbi:MAG: S53 family peptidase [Bryobacteraceae bacterium]|jgi:kumamolisin
MAIPHDYTSLKGSEHAHPQEHTDLNPTAGHELATVTLILRRRQSDRKLRGLQEFPAKATGAGRTVSHAEFAAAYGADPKELEQVAAFARSHDLEVLESHPARRSVVMRGTVTAVNKAFAVELHDYQSPRGKYRGHAGRPSLPAGLSDIVEAVVGLDNRQVPAQHYATALRQNSSDPPNTNPLTPQQVAQLYNFPAGNGAGQTIGIYEMATNEGSAGYTAQDLSDTMQAFGGGLTVPQPIDVSVDGVTNSGVSDGETGLDITVASAIAQGAQIAVYFTGGNTQNIIHALQRMIHPGEGDPQPAILSISYGWGPDDDTAGSFSDQEYTQMDQLFQDAANLSITVLVSSGDSGAFIASQTVAQTSYPATEPWVIACGGTTIGNINGATFDEYAWNDTGAGGPGASGGGVSARYPLPAYQQGIGVPNRIGTQQPGRGVPDIAGNASENSGYMQFINGQSQPVGGTSAVAPLYAGLIALINANLGFAVGFINPTLYRLAGSAFRDIVSPPGPANNSFGQVTGYPVGAGWDACTGLGSVNGTVLQNGLQAAHAAK